MRPRPIVRAVTGLLAALVLAAVPAAAQHYPAVKAAGQRKDRAMLESLRRLTFAESTNVYVAPFYCECVEPTCATGVMLACGGEVLPFHTGFLTAARRTSRETCQVCGCAGAEPVELRATPVCAGL